MPSLLKAQCLFNHNLVKLLQYIEKIGYEFKITEMLRTKEQAEIYAKNGKGISDSLHCLNLAADIYLVEGGDIVWDSELYKQIGDYWETLHPKNRWGGKFKRVDAVHFEQNTPEGIN